MFLYVTEKIKHYHKVGITEQLMERINEYRTLIPDLKCEYAIDLPKNIAKSIEKLFKKVLRGKFAVIRRGRFSECYNLKLEYIKEFILNSSITLSYPLIHFRYINRTYGRSNTDLRSDRGSFKRRLNYSDSFFVYLDELYFNKHIPLMNIKKISSQKVQIKLINKITLKELSKRANWLEQLLKNFKLSNPLFNSLKDIDNSLINNTSIEKIINYIEKKTFSSIVEYLNQDEKRIPKISRRCLNETSSTKNTFLRRSSYSFEHIDKNKFILERQRKE